MDDLEKRQYTGEGKCPYQPLTDAWREPEPYVASQTLTNAVNTALYLRRPLLLEGDAGCGKTIERNLSLVSNRKSKVAIASHPPH